MTLPTAIADAPIRVLIVDDDAAARGRARDVVNAEPGLEVVGECADGTTAVALIRAARPDLVLLDVQMPGLDGFGVVSQVGAASMPAVVFTSAYAEFAVRAFEAYALDYVLKPFDDARLRAGLTRARAQVLARRTAASAAPAAAPPEVLPEPAATPTVAAPVKAPEAAALAEGASPWPPSFDDPRLPLLLDYLARPARPRYPDALAIRVGAQYAVVRVADVDWIEADGNHARVYVQKRPRLVTKSLSTLERDVLDPERFVRVHRSAIVNVPRVAAVEPGLHGDLDLLLQDGTRVSCSRRYRERLEERLYFTT